MKKSDLEKHLGRYVEVTLFDDFKYIGTLRKTEEKHQGYCKRNHYFLEGEDDNLIFRCPHVNRIRELF